MQHTLLDIASLGADAQRALAAAPTRMMAARGMAPIARPVDLVALFYQLSLDGDASVREAATRSAGELPGGLLQAALADQGVDARVLDFFSLRVRNRPELIEAIILNGATADETIAAIASGGDAHTVDLIATNEKRLLRHPDIISAMYMNKNARMSTVDRAIELAVRNQVKVIGIPAWDEICQALLESGKRQSSPTEEAMSDAEFERVLSEGLVREGEQVEEDAPSEKKWHELPVAHKIRLATIGGTFLRAQAIRDPKLVVSMAAVQSPGTNENEARKWASNQALARQVIAYISSKREWTQHYDFKLALVQNPKTPVTDAMKFVLHLRDKDIRAVARSRGIPAPVVTQARKLIAARTTGSKK
jgi:hypothetical protein